MSGNIAVALHLDAGKGFVADRLYRHDLLFRVDDGRSETLPVVQKFTSAAEVQTMQALAQVPGAESLPHLIDGSGNAAPAGEGGFWFVAPFYEGKQLTFADEVPDAVVRSLAKVHATSHRKRRRSIGCPGWMLPSLRRYSTTPLRRSPWKASNRIRPIRG